MSCQSQINTKEETKSKMGGIGKWPENKVMMNLMTINIALKRNLVNCLRASFLLSITALILGCTDQGHNLAEGKTTELLLTGDSLEVLDSLVEYYKIKDPDRARNCVDKAFRLARRDSSATMLARANLMAGALCYNFKPDSAFYYYAEAFRFAHDTSCRKILPRLYYNMAMIWFRASDYRQALIFMDSAILLSEPVNDFKTRANACNMMGSFYCDLGDSAKARDMFIKSFNIASEYKQYRLMGVALINRSTMENRDSFYIANLRRALGFFLKGRGGEQEIGMLYNNLGNHMAQPDSAIFYFRKAIEIGKLYNDREVLVLSYNNMAYSYLEKHELARAKECLIDSAIPIALRENNSDWLANLYDSYADVLMAAGDGMAAAGYLKKAMNAMKSAETARSASQTRLLMALLDLKNKELTIREHQQEIRTLGDKAQRMWIVVAILLFLFLITGLLAIIVNVRNKMKNQLRETENTRKLIALETTEKNRVAMQLHDLIGPVRNILTRQIEELNISDPVIRENILSKLQQVASTLRHLSHRMNSAMMNQLSFGELFETLHDDFAGMTDFPVVIEVDPQCNDIVGEITGQVFFIALELLTNGVKYSRSGSIRLSISVEFGKLYIFYHDEGPGFDPEITGKSGMGLSNIYERVKLMKGKATLISAPGCSTEWTICVPLAQGAGSHHKISDR